MNTKQKIQVVVVTLAIYAIAYAVTLVHFSCN